MARPRSHFLARFLASWLRAPSRLMAVASGPAQAAPSLERCLEEQGLVRLARVVGPDGTPAYARVIAQAAPRL